MKCTSPCSPPCNNEAAFKLLNKGSNILLGFNCQKHIVPLLGINDGKDYKSEELIQEK